MRRFLNKSKSVLIVSLQITSLLCMDFFIPKAQADVTSENGFSTVINGNLNFVCHVMLPSVGFQHLAETTDPTGEILGATRLPILDSFLRLRDELTDWYPSEELSAESQVRIWGRGLQQGEYSPIGRLQKNGTPEQPFVIRLDTETPIAIGAPIETAGIYRGRRQWPAITNLIEIRFLMFHSKGILLRITDPRNTGPDQKLLAGSRDFNVEISFCKSRADNNSSSHLGFAPFEHPILNAAAEELEKLRWDRTMIPAGSAQGEVLKFPFLQHEMRNNRVRFSVLDSQGMTEGRNVLGTLAAAGAVAITILRFIPHPVAQTATVLPLIPGTTPRRQNHRTVEFRPSELNLTGPQIYNFLHAPSQWNIVCQPSTNNSSIYQKICSQLQRIDDLLAKDGA